MAVQPLIRDLSPLDFLTPHQPGDRYGYRGTVIEAVADGWDVLEGDRPRDAQYAEIGWADDLYGAMEVANEHVDGFVRVKRAA